MSLEMTEELIARQSPEAQAIIRLLLAQLGELQAEVATLKAELAALKKTPENSSLPPVRNTRTRSHHANGRRPTRNGADSRDTKRPNGRSFRSKTAPKLSFANLPRAVAVSRLRCLPMWTLLRCRGGEEIGSPAGGVVECWVFCSERQ